MANILSIAAITLAGTLLVGCTDAPETVDSTTLDDGTVIADLDGTFLFSRVIYKDTNRYGALFRVDPATGGTSFVVDVTESFGSIPQLFITQEGFAIRGSNLVSLFDREGQVLEEYELETTSTDLIQTSTRSHLGAEVLGEPRRFALIDVEAREVVELEPVDASILATGFSPDGDHLYCTVVSGRGYHLLRWGLGELANADYAVDPATGLFAAPDLEIALPVEPHESDSTLLANADGTFVRVTGISQEPGFVGQDAIALVNLAASSVRVLSIEFDETEGRFTPDGQHLVYADNGHLSYLALDTEADPVSLGNVQEFIVSQFADVVLTVDPDSIIPVPSTASNQARSIEGGFDLGLYLEASDARIYNVDRSGDEPLFQALDLETGIVSSPIDAKVDSMARLSSGQVVLSDVGAGEFLIVDPDLNTVLRTIAMPTIE